MATGSMSILIPLHPPRGILWSSRRYQPILESASYLVTAVPGWLTCIPKVMASGCSGDLTEPAGERERERETSCLYSPQTLLGS